MIFKIQVPIASSENSPPALVYNKSRSIQAFVPVTKDMVELMDGELKIFAHGKVVKDQLVIERKADWQEW